MTQPARTTSSSSPGPRCALWPGLGKTLPRVSWRPLPGRSSVNTTSPSASKQEAFTLMEGRSAGHSILPVHQQVNKSLYTQGGAQLWAFNTTSPSASKQEAFTLKVGRSAGYSILPVHQQVNKSLHTQGGAQRLAFNTTGPSASKQEPSHSRRGAAFGIHSVACHHARLISSHLVQFSSIILFQ